MRSTFQRGEGAEEVIKSSVQVRMLGTMEEAVEGGGSRSKSGRSVSSFSSSSSSVSKNYFWTLMLIAMALLSVSTSVVESLPLSELVNSAVDNDEPSKYSEGGQQTSLLAARGGGSNYQQQQQQQQLVHQGQLYLPALFQSERLGTPAAAAPDYPISSQNEEDSIGTGEWETVIDPHLYVLNEWSSSRSSSAGPGLQQRKKRSAGPSLSIVNPLDVLRQRLLLEIARRKMIKSQNQILANAEILKNIGRRRR